MVVRILGLIDLLTALSVVLLRFGIAKTMALALAIYLIIKGIIFIKNITSMIDIAAGVVVLIAALGYFTPIITWIAAIWIAQKGVISLFS